jgi:hypothetical protein
MYSEREKSWRREAASSMRSLGDRRGAVRLEIVGSLWGTLQLVEVAHVVNISQGGALIMSAVAMSVDAAAPVRVNVGGHEVTLEARVRHLRHVPAVATQPEHYLIGLEFSSVPAAVAQALEN